MKRSQRGLFKGVILSGTLLAFVGGDLLWHRIGHDRLEEWEDLGPITLG